MKKEYLEGGKICNAHGVRGLVKAEAWCDSPKVLANQKRIFLASGEGYKEIKVIHGSVMGPLVLLELEGVSSREDAIALKNRTVYLHRSDIPVKPGAMLIEDMIGLDVIHVDTGAVLGRLVNVSDAVRSRIYTVRTAEGKDVLLPAVPEFIKEIDAERGIFVRPISGFFDEADEI